MSAQYLVLLFILLVVAAFVQGDFAFTILYLFLGAYLFGRLWVKQIGKQVKCKRVFEPRAFWGEEIPIKLEIKNASLLPVPWLQLQESVPVELATTKAVRQVVSLNPRGQYTLDYKLRGRKRGYYPIGPLFTTFGDMLGLSANEHGEGKPDHLTVYPLIIPLTNLKLPSYSPQGTLRHNQPIFEDPTRVLSKRDYVAGDSLRRVDWKATAVSGKLQVKQFEPSIALEVAIFLNLNIKEYVSQFRIDSTELAIVIAASVANWVVSRRQSIGLVTNGLDTLVNGQLVRPIPPRKGGSHLIRILETLAKVQSSESVPMVKLLNEQGSNLSWGTTIVLITGQVDEALFDELFQAKRRGQNIVLIIAGRASHVQETKQRAKYFGFTVYALQNEADIEHWRR